MNKKYQDRIIADPKIMTGKPIIKGTRITVELVLRLLGQGMAVEKILAEYPHLKKEDIYAAIHRFKRAGASSCSGKPVFSTRVTSAEPGIVPLS